MTKMTAQQFKQWKAENAQFLRSFIETRDVVLCNGTVLPNRKLTREYYELPTGNVKVKAHSDYTGWSNTTTYTYELVGA